MADTTPEPKWTNWQRQRARPTLDSGSTKTRFKGSVAVVAGGASGIGRACVERFLNDGARVAAFDIDAPALAAMVTELSSDSLMIHVVDVVDRDACFSAVEKVAADCDGVVNCLVNSVAYFGSKGEDSAAADWRKSFDVNVMGFSNMVQACIPHMKTDGGENCAVVNLASISSFQAQPKRWTYAATKGAIVTLTKCMALDLSEKGIRVNSIAPGWTWTREVAKAAEGDRAAHEPTWGKFHMLRRLGEVEECAGAATFLCSKDAAFITGTNLMVDGGYNAMGPEGLGENSHFSGSDY